MPVGELTKGERQRDQDHAEHDQPRSQQPDQREETGAGEDGRDRSEDDGCEPRPEQQPLVSNHAAQLDGGYDPDDPGEDRPGCHDVEKRERGDGGPDDDDDPNDHADDAYGYGPR